MGKERTRFITNLSSPSGQKSDIVASGKCYDAPEQGFDGFRAGAAERAWWPSPSPSHLLLPHGERKGEDVPSPSPSHLLLPHGERKGAGGLARKKVSNPLRHRRTGKVRAQ